MTRHDVWYLYRLSVWIFSDSFLDENTTAQNIFAAPSSLTGSGHLDFHSRFEQGYRFGCL